MSNRIDQLFKNKLSEHVLPPSEEAWTKVQNGLSKKNKVVIYWRAAAVFVLLGLLVSAWYLLTRPVEISTQQITKTENTEIQDKSTIKKEEEKEKVSTNTYATIKESKEPDTQRPIAESRKPIIIDKKETLKEELTEPVEPSSLIEMAEIGQAITVAEATVEKPIVLEFTLPTIEESTPADVSLADSETEKSTGIMKFLETARDVKNGDTEFGNSLRDIKNELFAFEFKKDKTRRN
jgi:hypothetical protein